MFGDNAGFYLDGDEVWALLPPPYHEMFYEVARQVRQVMLEMGVESDAYGLLHADLHMGNLLFSQKRYADAARSYREAIERRPEEGILHANLAGALLRLGRVEEARRAARRARDLGANEHWVYGELAGD